MPLCLMQSLPGTRYSLTDALTVAVPIASAQMSESVSPSCRKEVREGRVAWHTDSKPSQEEQSFSFENLAAMCQGWRDLGIFSFVEVRLSGEIGEAEKNHLHRLKQIADWLIVDGTSEMVVRPGTLLAEVWGQQVRCMKEIGRKVGLRLSVDHKISASVLFPWVAKVALELGAPGFLFVEGKTVEMVAAIVRGVQDILSLHKLSKDSCRLIPVVRESSHKIGEKLFEVLDFPSLDALLIESCRPFFGGLTVRQEEAEGAFGLSLWKTVVGMISEKRSSASFLEHAVDGLVFIPDELRLPLVRGVYDLFFWMSREDGAKIARAKIDLEATWGLISKEMIPWGDEMANTKAVVIALLEHCNETFGKVGDTSRGPSMIGSFFSSMNA
jgi:hypothetical protein